MTVKKVFAPKCLQGRPYYLTHDKFVRPCCYFTDHGWEPNAPEMEGGVGSNEWPIHHVKWLRDPKTNLNNYKNVNEVFETKHYRDFFSSLQKPIQNEEDLKRLPKRCIKKCYTARPEDLSVMSKYVQGSQINWAPASIKVEDPYYDTGVFKGSRKIQIDVTHRCRLGCPKCSRFISHGPNEGQRRQVLKDEFTVEDIVKIVGDGWQYRNYNFCGSIGDPIYNPHYINIIKYIREHSKSRSLHIQTHTNGSGKTAEWWREFFSVMNPNRDEVVFGVDGLKDTAHLYRKYIRFDDSIEAMKIGAEMGFKLNQWQFIVFKFNQHQVEEAQKLAKDIGIRFFVVKSDRWTEPDDPKSKWVDPLRPDKKWLPKDYIERVGL